MVVAAPTGLRPKTWHRVSGLGDIPPRFAWPAVLYPTRGVRIELTLVLGVRCLRLRATTAPDLQRTPLVVVHKSPAGSIQTPPLIV